MRLPRAVFLCLASGIGILPFWLISCTETAPSQSSTAAMASQQGPTIKDTYKGHFLIGTAADVPGGFTDQELALIRENFNIITPENYLKPAAIHPAERIWSFDRTDALVKWCNDNHIAVHGHTLAWHGQTNPWFFEGGDKDVITKRLQDHITTLVGHYRGRVHSWDVVNEAINDGGNPQTENLRNSQWLQNIGPEFLTIAFKAAHAADPDAKLYYNDYGIENGAKHESSMLLLKRLLSEGAPIYGVGIQGHWSTNGLPYAALEKAITDYASLGLKVSISELDITVAGTSGGQLNPGAPGGGGRGGRGRGGRGPATATAPGDTAATQAGDASATAPGRGARGGFGAAGPGGFAGGRGGRGAGGAGGAPGGGGAGAPAQPTVASAADSIRSVVADLSDDQRAKITAIGQDLATKLTQLQTSSQEALLVVQPQYAPGQQAYQYEIAHYNTVQFQQNSLREGMINDAEIAMVAVLTPAQALSWEKARLKEEVTARLSPLGLTNAQSAKADAIIAGHARKIVDARDKETLLAAKADFWKETVRILGDAQVSMLLAPAPAAGGGGGGRGRGPALLSAPALKGQADAYARVFAILEKHKDVIERVTFWGLNDRRSWRAGENPLIFDINNQRKPAYSAIVDALLQPSQP